MDIPRTPEPIQATHLLSLGAQLRIHLSESARHQGRPLYEWLIEGAQKAGLAQAVAMRGIMGFGVDQTVHSLKIERLSTDLPVVVEIHDTQARLEDFLASIENAIGDGITVLLEATDRS